MNANKITIKQKGGKFYLTSVTCALGFVIWTVQEVWAGAVSPGGESASNPLSNKKTNFKCTKKQSTCNKSMTHLICLTPAVRWSSLGEKQMERKQLWEGFQCSVPSPRLVNASFEPEVDRFRCFIWFLLDIYDSSCILYILWFIYFVSMLQCSKWWLFGYGQLNQNMICQIY